MQTLGVSQMKLNRQITVRLDVEDLEFLQEKAKRYKIPAAVLARQYVVEGLAEFDRKCCALHCHRSLAQLFVARFQQDGAGFPTLAS